MKIFNLYFQGDLINSYITRNLAEKHKIIELRRERAELRDAIKESKESGDKYWIDQFRQDLKDLSETDFEIEEREVILE